jgi:uncharacterized protein (UPF0332 family)
MYMRNYLKDGERHLEAATVLFENGFHDYSVKEAYESMLWHVDALLLTVNIKTFRNSTAIACFGREFVKKGIYPPAFYEHLLLANSSYRIADSEFGATVSREEAGSILEYSREFRDIVAYLKDIKVESAPLEMTNEEKVGSEKDTVEEDGDKDPDSTDNSEGEEGS